MELQHLVAIYIIAHKHDNVKMKHERKCKMLLCIKRAVPYIPN